MRGGHIIMRISFRDQDLVVMRIATALARTGSKRGVNLILPPGFREDEVAGAVVSKISEIASEPQALIAKLALDRPRNADAYIKFLHEQWGLSFDLPPLPDNSDEFARLESLLSNLPDDRPVVQIITRFHTVIDDRLGSWVLGTLREYERLGKLQTLAISHLPYSELKRRWVSTGHSLIVSNYGENHDQYGVEPLPAQENLQLAGFKGVPPGILRYVTELTGLYPEVFEATLQHWTDLGSPNLVPGVKQELRLRAERSCERLIEWLDPESTRFYRDHLTNLHLKIDVDDAIQALSIHPWKRILFDVDSELLRASA